LAEQTQSAKMQHWRRFAAIARRRTLGYSRTADRQVLMINGRVVDENRVDETVRLGDPIRIEDVLTG
jgi:hypothetical protein